MASSLRRKLDAHRLIVWGAHGNGFTLDPPDQVRKLVPLDPVRQIVQKLFTNVRYYVVDDHRLHKTVHELDWNSILE
jgi:hypothetical protein